MEATTDLEWRSLTADDADEIARLDRATIGVDDRDDPLSPEDALEEFAPSWSRPAERSLAAVRPDGSIVGLAWLQQRPASSRGRVMFLVHPDARSGEVPRRLLQGMYDRSSRLLKEGRLPEDATLELSVQPQQTSLVALLEAEGFIPVRTYNELYRDLAVPLGAPAAPADVRISGWSPRWSEPTRQAHVEAFADHWGSTPPDEETWEHHYVGSASFRSNLSFVATRDDEVAGYLLADVWEQDWELKGYRDAWVGMLGTRRAWRGRGVASALLLTSMHRMRVAGMEYASIGVDSESPTGADRLYAGHGFTVRRARISYARPVASLP